MLYRLIILIAKIISMVEKDLQKVQIKDREISIQIFLLFIYGLSF